MRQLIKCPRCLLDNRDKVIAELLPGGTAVAIARQRSKYSYEESTIVVGDSFTLLCGYCRTAVYIKKEVSYVKDSNFGKSWVHRVSFMPGSVIQEVQSFTNHAGTVVLTDGFAGVL